MNTNTKTPRALIETRENVACKRLSYILSGHDE